MPGHKSKTTVVGEKRKVVNGRLCRQVSVTCMVCLGAGEYSGGGGLPIRFCDDCNGTGHDPDGPFLLWQSIDPVDE